MYGSEFVLVLTAVVTVCDVVVVDEVVVEHIGTERLDERDWRPF